MGGHPDDPETGCGGTVAMLTAQGHEVTIVYLTSGEAGIPGKTNEQAAKIRTAEAASACRILGARPVFAGQVDGATELNRARYEAFRDLLLPMKPDLLLAHWPVDTHRDHRAASLVAYDAWLASRRAFALYYFEVMTGAQTQNFSPTDWVDITSVEPRKRLACYEHKSQDPDRFYAFHAKMHTARGLEAGVPLAEAFVRHAQSRPAPLPTPGSATSSH